MSNTTFLQTTLKEYINKKFFEWAEIKDTNEGYSIGRITLEAAREINSYTLEIMPAEPNSLIISSVLMPIDGAPVMEYLALLHHAQEYSHIADAIKKLL